jgi:lipopolysaccharide transport system permease protein
MKWFTSQRWQLLYNFVSRDLKGRYAGSAMGFFWNILNPLILLGVYTFVFSYVLKNKLPRSTGTDSFPIFLFCGLMPWISFSEAVTRSTTVITDNASLIKKIKFPPEMLVVYIVISSIIHEMLALGIFFIFLVASGGHVSFYAALLPVIIVMQVMLTLGLSYLLSSLNVYIRDIPHIMGAAMMVWFFATPIVYPLESVPGLVRGVISFNPVAQLVEIYRDLLLRGQLHSSMGLIYFAVISVALYILGSFVFSKFKKNFSDLV